jgi:hypothetical protein
VLVLRNKLRHLTHIGQTPKLGTLPP